MNEYQVEQYNGYLQTGYQPQFLQTAVSGLIGFAMVIAVGAWAFSIARKAFKGEEVEFPL